MGGVMYGKPSQLGTAAGSSVALLSGRVQLSFMVECGFDVPDRKKLCFWTH